MSNIYRCIDSIIVGPNICQVSVFGFSEIKECER